MNKHLIAIFAVALTLLSSSFAAPKKTPRKSDATTLQGYLVDVSCANEKHKSPDWAAKHSKGCLNMDECVKSGYAVLTPDQKLYKFDVNGNESAKKLIAATDKKDDWKVTVKGDVNAANNAVAVTSLELQK